MPTREYERLGLDDVFYEILGLRVPLIRCRWRRAATSRSWSRSRRATSCCGARPSRGAGARRSPRRVAARAGAARARRGRRGDRDGRIAVKKALGAEGRARGESAGGRGARGQGLARRAEAARERRPAVHRPHRPVRLGQVAGDPRARGSRLLLRRQPADDADSDAGEAVAARRRRHREGRDRRRRARGRLPVVVPEDLPAAAEDAAAEPGADLPRGEPRGAGAPLQRDAAAAPAGAGPLGRPKASATSGSG